MGLAVGRHAKRAIPSGRLVAVDTETTGLHYWQGDQPYAVSFCNEAGQTGYYEWPVDPFTRRVQYDPAELRLLKRWFADPAVRRVWFNGKFDRGMIREGMGLEVRGEYEEVQFAAHTCNSLEKPLALKPLAIKYAGMPDDDLKALKDAVTKARRIGKKRGYTLGVNAANGDAVPEADYWMIGLTIPELAHLVKRYAVLDAERTMVLWLIYREVLDVLGEDEWDTYRMELELEPVVERMEGRGIHYSPEENAKLRQQCVEELAAAIGDLQQFSGRPDFNPKAPTHVMNLLYSKDACGKHWADGIIPLGARTKTGLPSTAYKYVQLFKDRPQVQALFRHKSATKGLTVYFRVFETLKRPDPHART